MMLVTLQQSKAEDRLCVCARAKMALVSKRSLDEPKMMGRAWSRANEEEEAREKRFRLKVVMSVKLFCKRHPNKI